MSELGHGELQTVHLLELPVPLAAQAQQWFEELMREFALIHGGAADHERPQTPGRLTAMVDALVSRFAGVNDDARDRLEEAIDRRDLVIADHVMQMPAEAAAASIGLAAMMDEADEFCRQGQHLLTLAEPQSVRVYRTWYLAEVVAQLGGAAPVPWPEYRDANS
ncbi:MAG: hypothetical protein JWO12_1248 [Frankiales bacterium]|nr:hypothetical protein [Frankiales bacterium]